MNKCEIDGCFHEVAEDSRCVEHGGHPAVETHTDCFGYSEYAVHLESEGSPQWTTETSGNANPSSSSV